VCELRRAHEARGSADRPPAGPAFPSRHRRAHRAPTEGAGAWAPVLEEPRAAARGSRRRVRRVEDRCPAWVRTTRGGRDPPGARKRGGRTRARIPPGHLRGDLRAEGRAPAGLAASRRPGQGGFFRLRASSGRSRSPRSARTNRARSWGCPLCDLRSTLWSLEQARRKCMNETRGARDQFKDAYLSPLRLAGSLALLALLAASLDCSSTSCVPGASVACVGAAGCTGGQVCTAAGEGYGPCMCGADSGGDDADTDSRPLDATMDHELHDATIDHERRDAADATDEMIEVEDTKPMDRDVVSTPCSSATDCPPNEACEASVCSTSCSASSPCNGGCCDGTSCQIGNGPTACGEGGGLCASCPLGQACTTGACSTACGASSSACNGGCCDGVMCQSGSDPGACGVTGGSCVTCSGASACLPTGKCGCASAS